ncbi:MAG: Flp1 family type IVb pilin [Lachnospiraceae bacterium]|nr:Flp1 family type IVb pilin [Lachnospiraceae bacterium]
MKVSTEKTTQNFDNRGIGVVEIILILVVLIGLVLIFKSQLTELVRTIFDKITSESSGI